jgi:hypothetical protein
MQGSVATLDPARARSEAEILLASLMHQPLLTVARDGGLQPVLLRDVVALSDGLGLRCALRRGLRFHDGRPVRSNDVRYSFRRLAGTDSPAALVDALVDVRVLDGERFELRWKAPVDRATLERLLALPQAAVIPSGSDGAVGAGPFVLTEGVAGSSALRLSPHLGHPHGRPYLDQVELLQTASAADEAERFYYGRLDVALRSSPRYVSLDGVTRVEGPPVETIVLRGESSGGSRLAAELSAAVDRRGMLRHIEQQAEAPRGLVPGVDAELPSARRLSRGLAIGTAPAHDDLSELARALRDAAELAGGAGSRVVVSNPDARLVLWRWIAPEPTLAAAQAMLALGAPLGDVRDGVVRSAGRDTSWAKRTLGSLVREGRLVPVAHLARAAWVRGPVHGLRFSAHGVLDLANAWRGDAR